MFSSHDEGETWQESIDLENEGGYGCESATCIATDASGKYAVGTGCGFIMMQSPLTEQEVIPIVVPIVENSSSSSSDSSSNSSPYSLSSTLVSSVRQFSSIALVYLVGQLMIILSWLI